jgi:hypothetical protein
LFDSVVVGFGLKCRERLEWDPTLHASFLSTDTRVETCTTSFRSPKAVSKFPSFRGSMPLHPFTLLTPDPRESARRFLLVLTAVSFYPLKFV